MSTVRELAAESIGRITRRGLEPQLAQIDAALEPRERVIAVAPGHDGPAGVVIVVTDRHVLLSRGAPFTRPELASIVRSDITSATAHDVDGAWSLQLEHHGTVTTVPGMFDRDAQRLAGLLT